MQVAAQEQQASNPVVQEPQTPPQEPKRNPTAGQPPPRRNAALQERNKQAAEFLRQQRGVEPVKPSEPEPPKPAEPEKKPEEKPAPPPPPPKQSPDAVAEARRLHTEAQKMRDEAAAAQERLNNAKDDPVGFLSELGMTEEDWKKFNASGGIPAPVAKALREQKQWREDAEKRLAAAEAREKQAVEDRDISAAIGNFPLVRKIGGATAARAHFQAMRAQGQEPGTWAEVMTDLEAQYSHGLKNIFADDEINAKYGFKPQPQHQAPAPPTTPTTLGTQHASGISLDANAQNPYPVGSSENREWKRKRMQAFQRGAIKG